MGTIGARYLGPAAEQLVPGTLIQLLAPEFSERWLAPFLGRSPSIGGWRRLVAGTILRIGGWHLLWGVCAILILVAGTFFGSEIGGWHLVWGVNIGGWHLLWGGWHLLWGGLVWGLQ